MGLTIFSTSVFGNDILPKSNQRHHSPPAEAYEACEDKNVGDSVELKMPNGKIIVGTCEQDGEKLVLRPNENLGKRHHGPPPEAYEACEDKSAGDSVELKMPNGKTVVGTCEQEGDQLVLRPSNKSGKRRQGPPPEAYEVCEDKNVGDSAEIIAPNGKAVVGTCEQEGDRLVLRPNRK